jgi:EPS-associated MarR family transcriptional regulator
MAKLDDDITYELFKNLEQDPHLSQRALSNILGISLGKVNYCLKALAAKGWLKAENFKKNPNKFGYAYILTPSASKPRPGSRPVSCAARWMNTKSSKLK